MLKVKVKVIFLFGFNNSVWCVGQSLRTWNLELGKLIFWLQIKMVPSVFMSKSFTYDWKKGAPLKDWSHSLLCWLSFLQIRGSIPRTHGNKSSILCMWQFWIEMSYVLAFHSCCAPLWTSSLFSVQIYTWKKNNLGSVFLLLFYFEVDEIWKLLILVSGVTYKTWKFSEN